MATKAREPTKNKNQKEKAFALWLEYGGINAPRGTLNKIAEALNVTDGTVRGWKNRERWDEKALKISNETETISEKSNKKGKKTATKEKKIENAIKNKEKKEIVATEKMQNSSEINIVKANEMFLQGKSATDIAKKNKCRSFYYYQMEN